MILVRYWYVPKVHLVMHWSLNMMVKTDSKASGKVVTLLFLYQIFFMKT